ncbi:MAG: hypothetical protein ACK56F_15075, partial [bacterium]
MFQHSQSPREGRLECPCAPLEPLCILAACSLDEVLRHQFQPHKDVLHLVRSHCLINELQVPVTLAHTVMSSPFLVYRSKGSCGFQVTLN